MKKARTRAVAVVLGVVASFAVAVPNSPVAHAAPDTCPDRRLNPWSPAIAESTYVQPNGVCVYGLGWGAVGIFYTASDTKTTVDPSGRLEAQVGVSVCHYEYSAWNGPWKRSCVANPLIDIDGARWVTPDPTAPGVHGGTSAGPCAWVERHPNTVPYIFNGVPQLYNPTNTTSVGDVCVFGGGTGWVYASVPGKEARTGAAPGVCIDIYPDYVGCWIVESRTSAYGSDTVPSVRQTVSVCERTWPYPPCVVYDDRWLIPAGLASVKPTGTANGQYLAVSAGGCATASKGVAVSTGALGSSCGSGWSSAPVSASTGGGESTQVCQGALLWVWCTDGVVVATSGPASSPGGLVLAGGGNAVSGTGTATGGTGAVSGTNTASAPVAVSGTGNAYGGEVAVSGTGQAQGGRIANIDTRP